MTDSPHVSFAAGAAPQSDADARRWEALRQRDSKADGHFVYSVRTTGVYCRPSCAARAARPENVAFHATAAEAEAAGFRPCRRCRPEAEGAAERQAALVARACRTIEAAETLPALETLARQAGLSPSHFHRMFKAAIGVTPKAYAEGRRADRAATRLREAAPVTTALYDAGYGSSSRFYASSTQRLGMTPSAYRDGGAGAEIHFAIGECSLGSILVAATPKGVAAILLGDDPRSLLRDLEDRFPKARLEGGDIAFETLVARVVGLIEAPGTGLDLPLDIGGTAFQQRVWQALRAIPPGSTASYAPPMLWPWRFPATG